MIPAKFNKLFILIFFLFGFAVIGCKVDLFNELSEKEANRVLTVLQNKGIKAEKFIRDKRKGYYGIEVDKDEAAQAVSILNQLDLPSDKHRGYDLVTQKSGLLPSPGNKVNRYYIALAGELAKTMERLPGIHFARIHFAIPQNNTSFGHNKKELVPEKASVVLKVNEAEFQMKPTDVQTLVAGSIAELEAASVSVIIQLADLRKIKNSRPTPSSFFSFSPLILIIFGTLSLVVIVSLVVAVFHLKKRLKELSKQLSTES
ncbi:MAG: hypothetical protein PF689_14020 [Deltaproteobacteria bacterium]|jgi:type III secretion system YscJ/HrcJ family lipoprotein|nr:hypothetical protein [Deltaproteobacteria bacterium]